MAIPESFLDELRARLPLAAVVGRRVQLRRVGRDLKGLCPFHAEKTPSFHVREDKGFYHCFGCGAHGDAIRFVMNTENLGFLDAVEKLASEAGLAVPKPTPEAAAAAARQTTLASVAERAARHFAEALWRREGAAALAYLRGRGLSDDTITTFGLGWSGEGRGALAQALKGDGITEDQLIAVGLMKQDDASRPPVDLFFNRVMFPIHDRRGRVIGFGGRILGDGQPKYLNGPETALFSKRRTLYGLHHARAASSLGKEIIAVEGYMDVIALHQAGFGGAVAPLGTALTEDHLAELWRLSPAPILCFDGDAAGARAALRTAELALPKVGAGRTLRLATLPAGEDPDTLARRGAEPVRAVLGAAQGLADALFEAAAGSRASTPEARAAQRRRLEDLAGLVGDPTLREEYRRHWRDRWFAAGRAAQVQSGSGQRGSGQRGSGQRGYGQGNSGAQRAPRPGLVPERAGAVRERDVLALILSHPSLLPEAEEALANLQFRTAACERLRAALVAQAEQAFGLDSAALIDHLRQMDLREPLDAVLGTRLSALPACTLPGAAPAEAREAFFQALGQLDPGRLAAEIAEARAQLAADFTEANERRLVALVQAQSVIDASAGGGGDDAPHSTRRRVTHT
ncbi:DNA primase [Elioraea rosea]|uniref:DNA primase n=1 Tax=Elioraea rosea TaxID=2492390 RepID=UPI001183B6E9|nr:DNA primase [Elioraea rosea]